MIPIDGDALIRYIESRCKPDDMIPVWQVIEIIEHRPMISLEEKINA